MVPFFVLLFVPIVLQHTIIRENSLSYQKRNDNALIFFFGALTVLTMFRHTSVGNDTENYVRFFGDYCRMNWTQVRNYGFERGYSYFNKLISLVSEEPRFFLIVTSFVSCAIIYPTYKRLCADAFLTILLFCNIPTFLMLFSGIRQVIAIGIGCIAYEFTRKRKLIPFVLMVLLAISFHASAVMLAFMYPLYHAKITKNWLYVVVPAMLLVFIFNEQIFPVLTMILAQFTRFEGEIEPTGAYTMLFLFAAFAVFSFVIPDEKKLDQEVIGMRNFLLLSLVVQLFAPVNTLAMRLNYYYIIFIPLLLPKIIACRQKRWNQVALLGRHIMVIFFLLYFFMNARDYDGNLHVFPYRFFWERGI